MAESETGRWVSTFATDTRPGDKIRRSEGAPERRIVDRNYPPVHQSTFHVDYADGGESIGKLALIEIWDPDGSVSRRVQEIKTRLAQAAAQ